MDPSGQEHHKLMVGKLNHDHLQSKIVSMG